MRLLLSFRSLFLSVIVCCVLACTACCRAQISVVSQNTLHYGWSTTNATKLPLPVAGQQKIQALLVNIGKSSVAMLQEVMPTASGSFFVSTCTTCTVVESPSYGNGRYRERYMFVVTDINLTKPAASVVECKNLGVNCGFARPPAALLLSPPNKTSSVYVVDFHAIWGRSKAGRVNEARLMPGVLAALQLVTQNSEVVVGGDWNLTASEVSSAVGCNNCSEPSGLTTLNPQGKLSSSYDHFIWSSKVTGSNFSVIQPLGTLPVWRKIVSDHLGVLGSFNY